jgi:hypothetical protein
MPRLKSFSKDYINMWHSYVGLLSQILHFSYLVYNYVLHIKKIDYILILYHMYNASIL